MNHKNQRVTLYVRVSTDGLSVENQTRELQAIAERHGWIIIGVFSDPGVSGMKEKRPAFDKLLAGVARKEFDVVAAWSVDRLGRSLCHLLGFIDELKAKGLGPLPAPAGARRGHAGGPDALSDGRRVRRVRAGDDRGAGPRGSETGARAGQDTRAAEGGPGDRGRDPLGAGEGHGQQAIIGASLR
jgi:hypothetical protein